MVKALAYSFIPGDWESLQYIINDISMKIVDEGSSSPSEYILASGTREFTGNQSMGSHKITFLATPTTDYDASTKKYVDDSISSSYAFKTITGITNDVVADSASDTLTLSSTDNKLSIVGTTATDTITFTVNQGNIDHDALANFVSNEHIDWTNASSNFLTNGALGAGAITGTSFIIGASTVSSLVNLSSLAGLSYSATSFVKMTAAGTFALDINTYSLSSHDHSGVYEPAFGFSTYFNQAVKTTSNPTFKTLTLTDTYSFTFTPLDNSINSSASSIVLRAATNNIFRGLTNWTGTWSDSVDTTYFQVGKSSGNVAFSGLYGTIFNRFAFIASKLQITPTNAGISPPTQFLEVFGTCLLGGNVTIGVGGAGVDYSLTFNGETNDGILTWMEDEDQFKFSDDIMLTGGENIITDTSTGTKIGTATSQLLGFWNATPVNQPDTVADAATQDLTGTDTIDQTKLEADLTSCKNAVNTIIDRLQESGLIA